MAYLWLASEPLIKSVKSIAVWRLMFLSRKGCRRGIRSLWVRSCALCGSRWRPTCSSTGSGCRCMGAWLRYFYFCVVGGKEEEGEEVFQGVAGVALGGCPVTGGSYLIAVKCINWFILVPVFIQMLVSQGVDGVREAFAGFRYGAIG